MTKPARLERRTVDGIVLLDKPAGLTSNAALQRVKRLYRAEKAGHTGSLDPMATGLLPICLGQATKLCGYLLDADKRYIATARLGARTSTGDAEGEVVATRDASMVTKAMLDAAIPGLLGEIAQIPPMYSALKREGRPLYEFARAGQELERQARLVVIRALRLSGFDSHEFSFETLCSKGTYIRTLAEDWAASIDQLAYLTALRRLQSGPFNEPSMHSMDALEANEGDLAALDACLLPVSAGLQGWRRIAIGPGDAARLRRGLACGPFPSEAPGAIAVFDDKSGRALAIAEIDDARRLNSRRWLGADDTAA